MEVLQTLSDLNAFREKPGSLALIPTMGALHDGHLSLVREGLKRADSAVVSIFVNPTQFAPGEDLDTYPRTWDSDIAKLEELGAHAVWAPGVEVMYPNGSKTDTHIAGLTGMLEGEFRPHFFDGVATVVRRLFTQMQPDIALFGEKDYQQLLVVRQMVVDYNMPIDIIGVPTVRDDNGLALSSRNAYLDSEQYQIAIELNKTLFAMAEKIRALKGSPPNPPAGGGEEVRRASGGEIEVIETWAADQLLQAGFNKVDYCTIRDAKTLQPSETGPYRILAAAWIDKIRLIDNIAV